MFELMKVPSLILLVAGAALFPMTGSAQIVLNEIATSSATSTSDFSLGVTGYTPGANEILVAVVTGRSEGGANPQVNGVSINGGSNFTAATTAGGDDRATAAIFWVQAPSSGDYTFDFDIAAVNGGNYFGRILSLSGVDTSSPLIGPADEAAVGGNLPLNTSLDNVPAGSLVLSAFGSVNGAPSGNSLYLDLESSLNNMVLTNEATVSLGSHAYAYSSIGSLGTVNADWTAGSGAGSSNTFGAEGVTVAFAVVPEPSTTGLALLGLIDLAIGTRRGSRLTQRALRDRV